MIVEELMNDANFIYTPKCINEYVIKNAERNRRYVSAIQLIGDDVIERTFAFINDKKLGILKTEVQRRSINCPTCCKRNIYFVTMGGWHPVFTKGEVISRSTYYGYNVTRFYESEWNEWWGDARPLGVCHPVINADILKNTEFEYCGYKASCGEIIDYLRQYKKYPQTEYLGKLGIKPSILLMRKAKKDKRFIKFIAENAKMVNTYGPKAAIRAYDEHITFFEAYTRARDDRQGATAFSNCRNMTQLKIDKTKLYKWCQEQKIFTYSYTDYWNACIYLGLDMKDTKNLYPKNFKRMHDLRVDEYSSAVAAAELEKKKELDNKFNEVAKKYIPFEQDGKKYAIVMPRHISDLIVEGSKLSHCVGKMGYDVKMAEERSVIVFVRTTENKTEPFVTVEFKDGRVLQCYGEHDSRPAEDVIKFAETWVKRVNKQIKVV